MSLLEDNFKAVIEEWEVLITYKLKYNREAYLKKLDDFRDAIDGEIDEVLKIK